MILDNSEKSLVQMKDLFGDKGWILLKDAFDTEGIEKLRGFLNEQRLEMDATFSKYVHDAEYPILTEIIRNTKKSCGNLRRIPSSSGFGSLSQRRVRFANKAVKRGHGTIELKYISTRSSRLDWKQLLGPLPPYDKIQSCRCTGQRTASSSGCSVQQALERFHHHVGSFG